MTEIRNKNHQEKLYIFIDLIPNMDYINILYNSFYNDKIYKLYENLTIKKTRMLWVIYYTKYSHSMWI